ncbi:MAG TPA: ABC transporter substrate-binding protein, partial [Ilumatobacteraceae bacterium]|nr:ABC transporter substrate-binding protein [Ilumatobacteraceae bacterium]
GSEPSAVTDPGASGPSAGGSAPGATTGETEDAGGDAAPDDVDPDATLRYGAANLVTRFDAHKSSNGYDQNWLAPVYDRLIWQTPEVELEPGLATEWAFTDDLHFEMTLREGVTFSDGTPFDADAVAANIDRAKNVEGSGLAAYLASVDTVEVIDPTHVRFVLNRPDATLPMQLATRPGMMISPAAFENPDLDSQPVGSGPYELVEYREGDMAAYERRDDYWNPDYAGVKRLEIYYIPDSTTRLNGLRTGAIDATPLDAEQIEQAEDIDGVDVTVSDTIQLYHFQLDRTKSEFGNPLVRQAMAHAIDRQSIIDALFFGYGTLATQWVAPGTPYYVDDLGDSTTYDPERARELLAEAGLPDGFTFDAMTSVQPTYVKLAEVLQGMFGEVGITMNVTQEPNLADAFFVRNATDAIVSAYPGRIDPAETAQIYFNDQSFSNPGRQNDPEVQQAWVDSLVPGDDRPARLEDLLRAIDESMPNLPMLYPQIPIATTERVHGLVYYQSGHIEFAGVTMSP